MDDPAIAELLAYHAARRAAPCVHCGRRRRDRQRRGLCRRCADDRAVAGLYPPSKYARKGAGLDNVTGRPPATPTTAEPGTPEKVAVLAERARLGVQLFHPDDASVGPSTPCRHDNRRPQDADNGRLLRLAVLRNWSVNDLAVELGCSWVRARRLLKVVRAEAAAAQNLAAPAVASTPA